MSLWIHDSDSVAEFVENSSFMESEHGTAPTLYNKEKLFDAYRVYCSDKGLEEDAIVKSLEEFSKHIHYCGFLPWRKAFTNPNTRKREYRHCYRLVQATLRFDERVPVGTWTDKHRQHVSYQADTAY